MLRFDLCDPEHDETIVAQALRLLLGTTADQALLVVYTDEGSADPLAQLPRQELLLEARKQFSRAGVGIKDAVIVRHGRWWSLLCDDPLCCAPEGTSVAHDEPTAVELTYRLAGRIPPLPSRAALVESLLPRPDPEVLSELDRLRGDSANVGMGSLDQLEEILDYLTAHRGAPLAPPMVALLIHLAQSVPCRDAATMLPHGDELVDAIAIWQQAYVSSPVVCRPQVGSILAVLAWEAGGGALATCVCESVLDIDPEHSLTRLTLQLIENRIQADPRPTRAEAESDHRRAIRDRIRQEHPRRASRRGSRGNGGGWTRLRRAAG